MPGAPLAGPGPYAVDTNNPAILSFFKVDAATFERWKTSGRVSLRELFLREGAFEWWYFNSMGQGAVSQDFTLTVNGGPIGMCPFDSIALAANPSPAGAWVVDRFEGDILLRPNDYLLWEGQLVDLTHQDKGEITVPQYEYWLLIAWKVKVKQEE